MKRLLMLLFKRKKDDLRSRRERINRRFIGDPP